MSSLFDQRSFATQAQIRRNAEEQNDFLRDLRKFEQSIKLKDEYLSRSRSRNSADELQKHAGSAAEAVPVAAKGVAKCTKSGQASNRISDLPTPKPVSPGKAKSTNEVIEAGERKRGSTFYAAGIPPVSPREAESPNEAIEERERKRGNTFYAAGRFDEAVKCYTKCLGINSKCVLAFSNRAMAYLKMREWQKAESDASAAIAMDSMHVKSFQRRSAARISLGKLRAALRDLHLAEIAASKSSATSSGQMKAICVEQRKVREALKAAIRRAPKRLIPVRVIEMEGDDSLNGCSSSNSPRTPFNCKDKDTADSDGVAMQVTKATVENSGLNELKQTETTLRDPIGKDNGRKKKKWAKTKTWYQFVRMWKTLQTIEDKSSFLSTIVPSKFSTIFKNGIERSDLLVDVISVASHSDDAADYLREISRLPNLELVVMMMTKDERALTREAIRAAFRKDDGGEDDANEVSRRLGC